MLSQNKPIADATGITAWHKAGYTGKGIRVAVLDQEKNLYNYQEGIIQRPLGLDGKDSGHVGQCCAVIQQIAPDAELFALNTDRAAWEWVLKNDIDIVSCSYAGSPVPADLLHRLKQSNLIVLAAAGNGSNQTDGADRTAPANYDWSVSVGAYDIDLGRVSTYSNGGDTLDCVACTNLTILNNYGKPIYFNGTSCATPLSASMLALVLQKEGKHKGWQWARDYIRKHSKDLLEHGKDRASGYGLFCLPEVIKKVVEIKMRIDSKTAYVDGKPVILDRAPEEKDGYTLVPVRFIAEALGCTVEYGGNVTRDIIIRRE